MPSIGETPIADLPISLKAKTILEKLQCVIFSDVLQISVAELAEARPSIGVVDEINELLLMNGYDFELHYELSSQYETPGPNPQQNLVEDARHVPSMLISTLDAFSSFDEAVMAVLSAHAGNVLVNMGISSYEEMLRIVDADFDYLWGVDGETKRELIRFRSLCIDHLNTTNYVTNAVNGLMAADRAEGRNSLGSTSHRRIVRAYYHVPGERFEQCAARNLSTRAQAILRQLRVMSFWGLDQLDESELKKTRGIKTGTKNELLDFQQWCRERIASDPRTFSGIQASAPEVSDFYRVTRSVLSTRAVGALERLKVDSFEGLSQIQESDIQGLRSIGTKTVSEIMDFKLLYMGGAQKNARLVVNRPSSNRPALPKLSTRAAHAWAKLLETERPISGLSREDILSLRNVGVGTADEIEHFIEYVLNIARSPLDNEEYVDSEGKVATNIRVYDLKLPDAVKWKLYNLGIFDLKEFESRICDDGQSQIDPRIISLLEQDPSYQARYKDDDSARLFRTAKSYVDAQFHVENISEAQNVIDCFYGVLRSSSADGDIAESDLDKLFLASIMRRNYFLVSLFNLLPQQYESSRKEIEVLVLANLAGDQLYKMLNDALDELVAIGAAEENSYGVKRHYESFRTLIMDGVDRRTAKILDYRFNQDMTHDEIGKCFNLTRARVQQLVSRQLSRFNSKCSEDYFEYFFTNYSVSKEDFAYAFGDAGIYTFLKSRYEAGSKSLAEAMGDDGLSLRIKDRVWKCLTRNLVKIDGEYVEVNRPTLIRYALSKFARDEISQIEFVDIYNSWLTTVVDNPEDYAVDNERSLNHYGHDKHVFKTQWQMIRYYDFDSYDLDEFLEQLNLESYAGLEISAKKIFDSHFESMKAFDIRNEYELHTLLKSLLNGADGITFNRMPTIVFGNGSRERQVHDLMLRNAPISQAALAALYEEEYGVSARTVLANYFDCIDEYYDRPTHSYRTSKSTSMLTADEIDTMAVALNKPFYFISDAESRYVSLYHKRASFTSDDISRFGFIPLGVYMVSRDYETASGFFNALMTGSDYFDFAHADKRMVNLSLFRELFKKRRDEYALVEWSPGLYITALGMERLGIDRSHVDDFVRAVEAATNTGQCFTIYSLRKQGFFDAVDGANENDWFHGGLLRTSNSEFAYEAMAGTYLFRKGVARTAAADLIMQIIGDDESVFIDDLQKQLSEAFGINPTMSQLLGMVNRKPIYYDSTTGLVFKSEGAYFDMIGMQSMVRLALEDV